MNDIDFIEFKESLIKLLFSDVGFRYVIFLVVIFEFVYIRINYEKKLLYKVMNVEVFKFIYKISFFYCFLKCDIMRNLVYRGMVKKLMIRFM